MERFARKLLAKRLRVMRDCLYINVWRPREKPNQPLPVMVWLHGGGNHTRSGEGSADFGGIPYNGEQLVSQGVVFVSVNSRLGVFGFLSHAALVREQSFNRLAALSGMVVLLGYREPGAWAAARAAAVEFPRLSGACGHPQVTCT
jgi:carboxylesterase type B